MQIFTKNCLFPACAGVILHTGERFPVIQSFPRVCGGDPDVKAGKTVMDAFSPRVRG